MLERFISSSHSPTQASCGESYSTHLVNIIAACKELKQATESIIPPTQSQLNRTVQNGVLGAHHPLGSNTNAPVRHSARVANASLLGRDNLVQSDAN